MCFGDSEVLNVRTTRDKTVRYRRCLDCGYRWKTTERDETASNDTGSTDNASR